MIEITNKKNCCGCTACFSICPKKAIEMIEDEEGFLYPFIDKKKCINCGLCDRICPIKNKSKDKSIKEALVIRNKNTNELKASTSGGFFSPLAKFVIEHGGVVYGVMFDNEFKVVHGEINNVDELFKFRGSKYVQSFLGNTFQKIKNHLEKEELVLFSGTPCQVEGLKKFLRKDFENLLTVDVICHGTPSQKLWKEYLNYIKKKYNSEPTSINFRNKTYGYHCGTMKIEFENGKIYHGSARVDYMLKAFFKEISSRPSCYDCKFKKINHISDFTIYDCWSPDKIDKSIKDDDKGYTNLIINSKKGQQIFEQINKFYTYYNVDYKIALEKDGIMIEHCPTPNVHRNEFYKMLDNKGIKFAIKKCIPIRHKDYIIESLKIVFYKIKIIKYIKIIKEKLKKKD